MIISHIYDTSGAISDWKIRRVVASNQAKTPWKDDKGELLILYVKSHNILSWVDVFPVETGCCSLIGKCTML